MSTREALGLRRVARRSYADCANECSADSDPDWGADRDVEEPGPEPRRITHKKTVLRRVVVETIPPCNETENVPDVQDRIEELLTSMEQIRIPVCHSISSVL